MNKTHILMTVAVLVAAAVASPAHAADRRYPISFVKKIEIAESSGRSAWENKGFLDCDDVVLTEEDVRYSLRHMRRVSWKAYAPENTNTTGCKGEALVTFKNGRILAMGIEPTGRIATQEFDAKMNPTATPPGFYDCAPCGDRKMALLKDALNRADERRFRQAVVEGKITPLQAEARLKVLREEREPKRSK